MASQRSRRTKVQRGVVATLSSGALRVRVDAGLDPDTKKRHRLTEIIPSDTPDEDAEADKARIRLVNEVHERRNPKARATVDQLLKRHLGDFGGAWSTEHNYRNLWANHVSPFIGTVKVGELDADILDSLYAELRRCRDHCTGPFTQHRTDHQHECDRRCGPHRCKPLGVSAIRQIHWLLSGAYRRAVRCKWVTTSPIDDAEPPPTPPMPQPPTTAEAARILNEAATSDLDWATLIWLTMTTGARRHELCALRWTDLEVDGEYAVLSITRGISKDADGQWAELGTKTHQQRRVTLDAETAQVLAEHQDRCRYRVAKIGLELAADAFVFSAEPDYGRFLTPGSVTQRYSRMAERLGVETTIHKLRHYSATELIKAGADINTVAGRRGHGGGGTTTLKVYTAFVSEADQRAAGQLQTRMPERDWTHADPVERAKTDPHAPYERIAAAIRTQVLSGALPDGAQVPTVKDLAKEQGASAGTVNRALALLRDWGLVREGGRGRRAIVVRPQQDWFEQAAAEDDAGTPAEAASPSGAIPLDLRLLYLGEEVRRLDANADRTDVEQLNRLLTGAARRYAGGDVAFGDYELEVRRGDSSELVTVFTAL
ncbi:tyrosine-type recombinase/integrase [Haloechinothrix alba]|nr:tyrosine-type recombinase/integrase [Haloechinothrix alba]